MNAGTLEDEATALATVEDADENLNQAMRALAGVSTTRWLAAALGDWAIIVACMAACVWMPTVWVIALAVFVVGSRQHALTVLGHDGAHYMAARNRRLNDFMTNLLCFWPIGQPVDGYRKFHFQHHRHLGGEQDPEVPIRRGSAYPMPATRRWFVARFALDLIGLGLLDMADLLRRFRQPSPLSLLPVLVLWGGVSAALWSAGLLWLLAVWVGAMVTSFWALFHVRAWTEHQGTLGTHRFHVNPLTKFLLFPHNTWCHDEHHRWPYIPFYRLPEARRLTQSRDKVMTLSELWALFASIKEQPRRSDDDLE